ncbi:MAG: hypothetical protein OXE52_00075 [Chloroflexi bacterium]|nr:hypothetical protein [Chloroflexota bacterium]
MAWTTPKTDWEVGELVSAGEMNAVSENLAELDRVRKAVAAHTTKDDIAILHSNTFVDIDSNFNLTITTAGGDVLVHFHGVVVNKPFRIDVEVDGARVGHDEYGLRRGDVDHELVNFTHLVQNLSAGSHTFKLQGRNSRTTLRSHAQFWVREI